MAASGTIKIAIKLGAKDATIFLYKYLIPLIKGTTAEGGKATGTFVAKQVPYISLLAGIGLCIYRYRKDQTTKAFLELASGVAALVPGTGTLISAAIDLVLASTDLYEAWGSNEDDAPPVEFQLSDIYGLLNLKTTNPEQQDNPEQQEFEEAFQSVYQHFSKKPEDLGITMMNKHGKN